MLLKTKPLPGRWSALIACLHFFASELPAQVIVFDDDCSTETNAEWTASGPLGSSGWEVFRSGTDWGARRNTSPEQLELSNDISGASNVNGWTFSSISNTTFDPPYTQVLANGGVVSWTFNIQQARLDPSGFDPGNYGMAVILAGETASAGNTGAGYAVVLGQSGATDPLRLVRYTDGIQGNASLTNIIVSNTAGLTDFGDEHLSVRVTYNPCADNQWELFVRNDGTSFADPASGTLVSQGTAVDATHTALALGMMAVYWQGSTAAAQVAVADNFTVTVTSDPTITLGDPPTGCVGTTSAEMTYTAVTGGADVYSIAWSPAALAAGFVNVTDGALPPSPIDLALPPGAMAGAYAGTLTVTNDSLGCTSVGYPFTLTVFASPAVSCPAGFDICASASPITLTGGNPVGGVFTGPGVTGGQFDPGTAAIGANEIVYTYTDTNGCAGTCTFSIVVLEAPSPEAGTYGPACTNDPNIPLVGTPPGGTWSGPGVINGAFDPTAGTQTITYTVTGSNGCSASDQTTITVNPCLMAPEMRWVLLDEGTTSGSCTSQSDCDDNIICFGLQYTPDTTGTLTSYTTGFLVDCLGGVNPVTANASCVMSNNSSTLNDCAGSGVVLMYSSGNSGNLAVTQGTPVIIHQVCFQIPGTPLEILEDEFTDLTAGIDIPGGTPITEFPSYVPFDIDSVLFCGILPLRFLDFEVTLRGEGEVWLDWTTTDEVNNSHFEVQRSADGRTFESIGAVAAAEEFRSVNRYRFVDDRPRRGRLYYRLKQVDLDGRYQYSPLRSVVLGDTGYDIRVWPNPARDHIEVRLSAVPAAGVMRLVDLQGRVVWSRDVPAGDSAEHLDTGHLPAGIYTLVTTVGAEIRPLKLVLDR